MATQTELGLRHKRIWTLAETNWVFDAVRSGVNLSREWPEDRFGARNDKSIIGQADKVRFALADKNWTTEEDTVLLTEPEGDKRDRMLAKLERSGKKKVSWHYYLRQRVLEARKAQAPKLQVVKPVNLTEVHTILEDMKDLIESAQDLIRAITEAEEGKSNG